MTTTAVSGTRTAAAAGFGAVLFAISLGVGAEGFNIGAYQCGEECHQPEFEVWEASPHQASFYKFDAPSDELQEKMDAILAAVGDEYMSDSETCTTCHFTLVQEEEGETPWVDSGPSCESCHGAGSAHQPVHSEKERDYDERMAEAESLGMIRPHMKFAIAENCNGCHAMARDEVDGDTITSLLDAGHPINPDFELVRYSQGSVKHRFYPPDTSVNADMTAPELANLYVQGQAAALVAATASLDKSGHADYQAAMQQRIDTARAALANVPGADAFLADPSASGAQSLIDSLEGQDLTGAVGDRLPSADSYIQTE